VTIPCMHMVYFEQVHPFWYILILLSFPLFSNSIWWDSLCCLHYVYVYTDSPPRQALSCHHRHHFGSTWAWTQSFVVARQVLYHLSYTYIPFFALVIFQIGSHAFWPGLALDYNLPTFATHLTGLQMFATTSSHSDCFHSVIFYKHQRPRL
jgi:hypothetical protein